MLRLTLVSRGYALDPVIAAPVVMALDGGQVTHVTVPGGWDQIEYGSGTEGGEMQTVTTSVSISDPKGELLSLLDAYDPRGSAAAIDQALPGLVAADWEPLFRGVLDDWSRDGIATKLHLKVDDTALRTPVPASTYERALMTSAAEGTVVGSPRSLVLGIHDAFTITARGQVPATCIRYDSTSGYWWEVSVGNMVEVRRVAINGVVQPSSGWTTRRMVVGAVLATIVVFSAGSQPQKNDVVTVDVEGPDADGLADGPAMTNPVRILRSVVEEYVARAAPLAGYRGAHAMIDADSWDAAEAWFEDHGHDCGIRLGGDQDATGTAAEVIQSFMESRPYCRIQYTELGTLAFIIMDPDDLDPDAALGMDLGKMHKVPPFERGDAREVYTHVRQPFLWSAADGKFASSYEAHDVAALPAPGKNQLVLEDRWSQARYTLE